MKEGIQSLAQILLKTAYAMIDEDEYVWSLHELAAALDLARTEVQITILERRGSFMGAKRQDHLPPPDRTPQAQEEAADGEE